jgi:hypothetical protein
MPFSRTVGLSKMIVRKKRVKKKVARMVSTFLLKELEFKLV